MPLFLYIAKFSLLALFYLSVYVASRKAFGPVLFARRRTPSDGFRDIEPGRLWLVPISRNDLVTPPQGLPCDRVLLIGRGGDCDLQIKNPFTSEQHARLIPHPTHCDLEDLDTANGTLVEALPIDGTVAIEEGSCFTIGDVTFRLIRKAV